ncbi:alcohol dehydrogenase catalytic domain-containing protein [Candidatus Poriferisocius sp.]|uniref:alcohol dehydrogenase catalytic domain-containing protein n=1 Tax=Candidatus Poriferisocius sp. TaxID=3101276 RepID=UPI003B58BFEF
MQAAELRGYGQPLELVEREPIQPGPGQVVVEVRACGVCGSDVFLRKGGFDSTLPIVPGHEASGVVARLGPDVNDVQVGTPVAVYYIEHCGHCEMCSVGRVNMCLSVRRMGVEYDGAFADEVLVPARNVIAVEPEDDLAAVAVLTDAVATPYHALVRVGKVEAGMTVVVLGVGGIGSNAVQVAALLGCDVVAVSRSPAKLDLAERLGARAVVSAADGEQEMLEGIKRACGPAGPQVVVQTVGSADVDTQAIKAVGIGGMVLLIGSSVDAFSVRAVDLIWKEASVHGSRGFVPDDIREVLDFYRSGHLPVDHLLGRQRPLSEANAALDDLEAGRVLRSVLVP